MSPELLDTERRRLSTADVAALSLGDLSAIIAAYDRLVAQRGESDPELIATIDRRIDEGIAVGRLTEEEAESLRQRLRECHPSVFLAGELEEIVGSDVLRRPTIREYRRAFPRRESGLETDGVTWLAADPRRLRGVVLEMARFSTDWRRIAGAVAELADRAGIDEAVADDVIADGIREGTQKRSTGA